METMPLDLTVLLRSSPAVSATFTQYTSNVVSLPLVECGNMILSRQRRAPAYRRVATFPLANANQTPKMSSLKYKSLSESNNLHKNSNSELEGQMVCPLLDLGEKCSSNAEDRRGAQIENRDSILLSLSIAQSTSRIDETAESPGLLAHSLLQHERKLKKKVAFADDRGLDLVSIRIMTEASDVPPKINYPAIMKSLFGDGWVDEEAVAKPCATWVVNFKQPASDYLAFRKKLDRDMVAVENVLVKNDHCRLVGTVKVKNICFEKEVFVRFTENDWKSYYDRPCKYLSTKGACTGGVNESYDTFQFDFEVLCDDSKHERMEFCVCFKTGYEQEYWDNNDGMNFEIISEHLRLKRSQMPTTMRNKADAKEKINSASHPATLNCTNWTEFASWSDLCRASDPYW